MFRSIRFFTLLTILLSSSVFSQATTFGVISDLLGTGVTNNVTPGMRCIEGDDVVKFLKSPILTSKVAYDPWSNYIYIRFQLLTYYQRLNNPTLKPFIRKDANSRSDLIAIRCGLKYISKQYSGSSLTIGIKLSPKEGDDVSDFKYKVEDLLKDVKSVVEGNRWGEYTTKEKVSKYLHYSLEKFFYWLEYSRLETTGFYRSSGGPFDLNKAINNSDSNKEALDVFIDFAWKKMSGKNDVKDGVWLETELSSILDLI